MSYFNKFPQLLYSTSLGVKNYKLVPNILAKTKFIQSVLDNSSLYYQYDVKDGERPEHIANRLYGDPTKHWIILLANDIVDPIYDWVLSQRDFDAFINKKYSTVELQLDSTESYSNSYNINEQVYQGSSYESSDMTAKVLEYDSSDKILTIGFCNEVVSNNSIISGVESLESHNIINVTYNNDGYNQATDPDNIIYYQVTETISNSYDRTEIVNKYKVSQNTYNHSTDSVVNLSMTEAINSYDLNDGTTLTIKKTYSPVNYYDHELIINENRRKIKVPKSDIIQRIESEFEALMK